MSVLRNILAVVAGFLTVAVLSTLADMVMHQTGVFPPELQIMSAPLFALALAYRTVFTIAGGWVTAKLAPGRPMRLVWVLAWIGFAAGMLGVVAYYTMGQGKLGPAWYALAIPLEAIPCVWIGGRLGAKRKAASAL